MCPQVDGRDDTVKVEVISSFFALVGTCECLTFAHISMGGGGQKGSGEAAVKEH